MTAIRKYIVALAFVAIASMANAYEVRYGYGILQDSSNSSVINLSNSIRQHEVYVVHNVGSIQNAERILSYLNNYHNEFAMQTTRPYNANNDTDRNEAIIWRRTSVDYTGHHVQYRNGADGFESAPVAVAFRTRVAGGHPFVVGTYDVARIYHNKWQSSQYMKDYVSFLKASFPDYRMQILIGDGAFVPSDVIGVNKVENNFMVPENLKRNVYQAGWTSRQSRTLTINFPNNRIYY